jgi:predicted MFS family arabinose efflux permease
MLLVLALGFNAIFSWDIVRKLHVKSASALSIAMVSIIFMIELLILGFKLVERKAAGSLLPIENDYGMMRPAAFLFLLGVDISMSFLPLHMGKLYQPIFGLSREVVMGLPISVEFGCVGITMLVAGAWIDRRGWREPFLTGLTLTGAGLLYSWLAPDAIQFIISRALAGSGYGLSLMASQGFVIINTDAHNKARGLAQLISGMYAGSICGSAIGAMLAERFGFNVAFFVGAVVIFTVIVYTLVFLRGAAQRPSSHPITNQARSPAIKVSWLDFLSDRVVIGLILFSSLPASIAVVGFLNYLTPIYLNRMGSSQVTIGWVLMIYGVALIYVGPFISRFVDRSDRKRLYVFLGCILGGLSFLVFRVLDGLWATATGALILGLSSCFVLASQSAYMLQLAISGHLGQGKALAIFRSSSRIGQAIGPIVFSMLVGTSNMDDGITSFGMAYILCAFLFFLITRQDRKKWRVAEMHGTEVTQPDIPTLTPDNRPSVANRYLDAVCAHSPVVKEVIEKYGSSKISDYLRLIKPGAAPPLQSGKDFAEAVYRVATPLLGQSIAQRVANDLTELPVVLTANHHGVDYFAQSVQGALLFAIARSKECSATTIPILSCGNVPLNNLTFPLGMLFYHVNGSWEDRIPKRLPIMPNRYKRCIASAARGFDLEMIGRAGKSLGKMRRNGHISSKLQECAHEILFSDYASQPVLNLRSYSDQSVLLNARLWKRLFVTPEAMPELVYLEIEKVVASLLESDLLSSESLAWKVMFDAELRQHVLQELDGDRTCWSLNHLRRRLDLASYNGAPGRSDSCGTIFFWGVDDSARKTPLLLDQLRRGEERLIGVDDKGRKWEVPFSPEGVLSALKAGKLLPSLFTCYLVVSLARSIVCLGGYYQAEYLPRIQQRLARALERTGGHDSVIASVLNVDTGSYLSGMQTVMTEVKEGHLIPAGPLEIIAGGALDAGDIEKIGSLTVREAHLASLSETVPDFISSEITTPEWQRRLAMDCHDLLRKKIVLK